eukprot:431239-Alexandrium_andersonii.AAC.1
MAHTRGRVQKARGLSNLEGRLDTSDWPVRAVHDDTSTKADRLSAKRAHSLSDPPLDATCGAGGPRPRGEFALGLFPHRNQTAAPSWAEEP